jgi:DnaJ-class molecular chaperone
MITRQYLSGCKWCGAKGIVNDSIHRDYTAPLTMPCPVCHGSGTILVTESIPVNEFSEPDHNLLKTST